MLYINIYILICNIINILNIGNYIQYLVILYNGKESEKEYIYNNKTKSLCCIPKVL